MDLRWDIIEEEWRNGAQSISKNVSLKLTQLKTIHRYHWTPNRMWRAGLRPDNTCWKCSSDKGSYLHMIWDMCYCSKCLG